MISTISQAAELLPGRQIKFRDKKYYVYSAKILLSQKLMLITDTNTIPLLNADLADIELMEKVDFQVHKPQCVEVNQIDSWSTEDDNFLISNHNILYHTKIAKKLNKTTAQVKSRIIELKAIGTIKRKPYSKSNKVRKKSRLTLLDVFKIYIDNVYSNTKQGEKLIFKKDELIEEMSKELKKEVISDNDKIVVNIYKSYLLKSGYLKNIDKDTIILKRIEDNMSIRKLYVIAYGERF